MEHGFQQAAAVGLGGGELGFELVAQGHQFVYPGDDAVLLGERGKGDFNLAYFPNAEAIKSAACDGQTLHDGRSRWRVKELQNKWADLEGRWTTSNDMILMNAALDLTVPNSASANL